MKKVEVIEVKRLGRPVDETSVRQQRLKEQAIKRELGEIRLGRPIKEDSERQQRLKALSIKRESGELKQGDRKSVV